MRFRRQFVALLFASMLASNLVAQLKQPMVKLAALATGKILLDGSPLSLQELDVALKKLKASGGVVWYYRDNPTFEPTPSAMAVIKLIVENGLPVSMSSKADFSDRIDASGRSVPREKK